MNAYVILVSLAALLPGLNSLPPRPIPSATYQGDNITGVIFNGGPDEVDSFCKTVLNYKEPNVQLVGCEMRMKKGGTIIVVENPCRYPDDRYARHVCHELGHVNGWPADHPDAQ